MESKISKNKKKWEIKSKDHYARVKVMKNEKNGEYYDVVFGLKGHKNREMRAHYGIKVVAENGTIGGKIFFVEPRKATSSYRQRTINQETGEIISEEETVFDEANKIVGAELHYGIRYDKEQKKAFLTEFRIVEK